MYKTHFLNCLSVCCTWATIPFLSFFPKSNQVMRKNSYVLFICFNFSKASMPFRSFPSQLGHVRLITVTRRKAWFVVNKTCDGMKEDFYDTLDRWEKHSLIVIQSLEEFWLGCMLIQLVLTISAWIFPFLQNTAIFQIKHKVWDNKQTHKLVVQIQLHVEQSFENTYTATEMQWVKCCRSCIELT